MNAKLNRSSVPAAAPRDIPAKRLTPAFSSENQPRQAAVHSASRAPVRVPVSPENRAYLKALRQAELAAWVAQASPARSVPPAASRRTQRLPAPIRDARENWLYALLFVLCALTLGQEVWSIVQSCDNWNAFVSFVRQLLV